MILKKYKSKEPLMYYGTNERVILPPYRKAPKVRGIWVSNVANIDTPVMKDVTSYKEYLIKLVERIASYNMNLIIFQVRPCCDAYYKSNINPWSRFITGEEGKDPGFDVLEFVINEAKKYNIEVHAWMNPYRVGMKSLDDLNMTKEEFLNTLAENNYARCHPEDTILDGTKKVILKPSSPSVIKYVTESIMEVVNNYDVTGVHIDDYFYPYAKVPEELEQEDYKHDQEVRTSSNTPLLSFDDWRRENVNKMIKSIHDELKKSFSKTNRKVVFGISPFAIYRTNKALKETGWEKGSFHSAGALECYSDLYSDVYHWMKEGYIDYVVPQVYFSFERVDVNYHDLTAWWAKICEETNTTLYIGHGLYQMGSNDVWANPNEMKNQLRFNEMYKRIDGSIFFTYRDLVEGQNPVKDEAIKILKECLNK